MKQIERDGMIFFQLETFCRTGLVKHAFTSRIGGVSKGYYEEMNFSLQKGEAREDTLENYRRLGNAISLSPSDFVMSAGQVHKTCVRCVTEEDRGKGILRESDLFGIDGLITNRKRVALTTFHADCVPLFFLDPCKRVIALSHAGWRGTIDGMAAITVQEMERNFSCQAKDILVGIGPSIGPCCLEVDEPVRIAYQKKWPFADTYLKEKDRKGKYLLDLWGSNYRILLEAGIKKEHMECAELCTMCHPELFYSHRVMGDKRGNMAAVLCLEDR